MHSCRSYPKIADPIPTGKLTNAYEHARLVSSMVGCSRNAHSAHSNVVSICAALGEQFRRCLKDEADGIDEMALSFKVKFADLRCSLYQMKIKGRSNPVIKGHSHTSLASPFNNTLALPFNKSKHLSVHHEVHSVSCSCSSCLHSRLSHHGKYEQP